ncbi:response regulator transcription factor [Desulforamulus ruminis]|uniref:Stage 0 sporulation protein A homolog n=1 Tax=Desulforamulus ruminis (strain ATCC 23193 / DSM 2154 / NCIMB 8452 / DL) TaxID=696281 RepID=F6DR16_DESRL|nr:response regulator transcription factor [Desulforamulus ruminis]AEG59735.1 response regulator receiver [Desulforamulus ruminis DSM 2154]
MEGKVLIIDDDQKIRRLISIYLENEGFKTVQVKDAQEGMQVLQNELIDIILLDVMLPDMDGIEACLKIRENLNMPIIMVSAKSEDMDKLQGITCGADDYITKPFNPMELIVRVKSQLRRYKRYNKAELKQTNVIEIGDLSIKTDTRQVWVADKEIRLTPKEFDILELLARNKGIVLNTSKIYEAVWREDFFKSDNTVMVHITKIREKIESDPKKPLYIKTVWGVGYKI